MITHGEIIIATVVDRCSPITIAVKFDKWIASLVFYQIKKMSVITIHFQDAKFLRDMPEYIEHVLIYADKDKIKLYIILATLFL